MTELIQDFSEWKTLAFLIVLHFFNRRFRKMLARFHQFPTEEAKFRC